MAEGVVAVQIGKLGAALLKEAATLGASLIWKEASALKDLFGEIRDVKEELESMHAYLQGAERFKNTDETTGIFVKKIRGLAFEIEDVVDEFTYKLEDKHGGFATKVKKRISNVSTWRRLSCKLRAIKTSLEGADKRKVRYDMRESRRDGRSDGQSRSAYQSLHLAREEEPVGIKKNKDLLLQWLTSDFGKQRMISAVWGMGGVGKTTLVAHVYNSVKLSFDTSAWITVSNSFHVETLLKDIARGFGLGVANGERFCLVESIHNYLQGKRYIIVLDDVWGVDVWFNIRDAFPTNSVSRFIITSRILEVALLATANCLVQLVPLEEHFSWELFCKEAFWQNDDKMCPPELIHLAQKFVWRCNGLPIAIACIGRLLSSKQRTYAEWEKIYKDLELRLTDNVILDVNTILKVSLEDLPFDLKNCFMHCAIFPEDYLIKRKTVIRHWMTAGFIQEKENKTMEEVAEEYLHELINRSLLQVVQRNISGRVRRCRLHDIIRVLLLTKANEECFCKAYNGSGTFSAEGTRCLSIQSANIEPLHRSVVANLRGLYVFERNINIDLLKTVLTTSNLLSSLDLQDARIKSLPNEVFGLFNLRFLGLRNTGIEYLPEAIGRLQNLIVLDCFNAKLSTLPKGIAKLKRMRYLYACTLPSSDEIAPAEGINVPKGIRHLTGLQALQCVKASLETLSNVGALTDLRTFSVSEVRSEHCDYLCNAVSNLSCLLHLEIIAQNEEELQLQGLHLPQTLSWLGFEGRLEAASMLQVMSSLLHLQNLTRLQLVLSRLDEESFSRLLVLQRLCSLQLTNAFEGKKLHFRAMSFPKLRYLHIFGAPHVAQIQIEESALSSLVELRLENFPELFILPDGIEHLTALYRLYIEDACTEVTEKLSLRGPRPIECSEYLEKINHIPMVVVRMRQKNVWERIP
ncbi:hypothetical protein SEVIR_5G053300v4 [Setaria viridis]|uniref:NB-ARC domain-containing protein n=1 Tax=Setaria viridis TaxID=4556 RepID=A0A4U6UPH1_SETVI|nr:disease resistance protein RPM1-like [Setaria viridis]TKW12707.1 hypothetical protein SEVIR_5G053300v2 [Setaria viridis]